MRANEFIYEGRIWDTIRNAARRLFASSSDRKKIEHEALRALAASLTDIKKVDYNSIDQQMKFISREFRVSTRRLHDLWVKQFGQTPDAWIKSKV